MGTSTSCKLFFFQPWLLVIYLTVCELEAMAQLVIVDLPIILVVIFMTRGYSPKNGG